MQPGQPKADALRLATTDDVPVLARTLARAFEQDPLIQWLVPQDAQVMDRAAQLFTGYLRLLALPHGMTWTSTDLHAAALWSPPGCWHMGPLTQARVAPYFLRAATWRHFPTRLLALEKVIAAHPREPHYYLQVMGVDPDAQGRGWGSQLLARGTAIADGAHLPCYLETMTERNVSLYLRHGFRVVGELTLPFAGPRTWRMWRDARPNTP